MVDQVDFLIACIWHPVSKARELTQYARRKEQKGLITVTVIKQNEETLTLIGKHPGGFLLTAWGNI